MDNTLFQQICNWIILIGGVAAALLAIWKIIDPPHKFFKKRHEQKFHEEFTREMDQTMPQLQMIQEQSIQNMIAKEFEVQVKPLVDNVVETNKAQNEKLDLLVGTTRDLLRERILQIYEENKLDKVLTRSEKEALDELFNDYKRVNGNGYVKKVYERMENWIIIDED